MELLGTIVVFKSFSLQWRHCGNSVGQLVSAGRLALVILVQPQRCVNISLNFAICCDHLFHSICLFSLLIFLQLLPPLEHKDQHKWEIQVLGLFSYK